MAVRRGAAAPAGAPAESTGQRRVARVRVEHVLVGLAAAVHLWLCWRFRDFVTDDAWISVRYAETLAGGHGFGWNPAGPRAEGFSNPLLVLVGAAADRVGLPALEVARVLGVLSGLACLVVLHARGRAVVGGVAAAVAALVVGCSAPVALWAVGGLETLPVALLVTVAAVELARPDGGRAGPVAAALAVLPWLRPEGLAVVLALVAASEVPGLVRRATRRTAFRRVLVLAGVPLVSQALLEALRLGIYGHLLPNSVLYKAGTGETFEVAGKFLTQGLVVVLLAAAGLALARGRQRLLAVPSAVHLAGSVGTLDSVNAFSRFFVPIWPSLALLAGVTVAVLAGGARRPHGVVVGAAVTLPVCLGVLLAPPGDVRSVDAFVRDYATCKSAARDAMAGWLRTTAPDTVFAVSDAGLVPARAGGRTAIDSFMLNDPLIQEVGRLPVPERADLVLGRRPDVLVLASRSAAEFVAVYPTDQALHDHPSAAGYRLAFVGSGGDPACSYHLMAFQR